MPHPDALIWDERYTKDERWQSARPPRLLVTSHIEILPRKGLALDIACGMAATGLHLAERGLQVIALDVSNAALRLTQSKVKKESLPVSFAVMDLTDLWLPHGHFDVILNFYYLSRPLWKTYRESLKPGGLLFFETFLREEGINQHHYLDSLELKNAFDDWEIIHYAETQRPSRSPNRPEKNRKFAQLVARKPKE